MNAKKDGNRISTLLATLNTDGITATPVQASASLHALNTSTASYSGTSSINANKDGNRVSGLIAVSSVDGVTPIPVWCDSSGNLLIVTT